MASPNARYRANASSSANGFFNFRSAVVFTTLVLLLATLSTLFSVNPMNAVDEILPPSSALTSALSYSKNLLGMNSTPGSVTNSTRFPMKNLPSLLEKYAESVMFTARYSMVSRNDKLHRMAYRSVREGSEMMLLEYNVCDQVKNLVDLFDYMQSPIVNFESVFEPILDKMNERAQKDPELRMVVDARLENRRPAHMSTRGEMLIVFTTCNQLSMTIMSLQYLRNTEFVADILVVDDHSTDGTAEYLRKKGFAVITKPRATGLTESWNIGYRLGVSLGYEHIVFCNNDVLLTSGTLALLHQGLKSYPMVLPMTTLKGSGHHPQQNIMTSLAVDDSYSIYVNDYRNAEEIQNSLLRKYVIVPPSQRRCPASISQSGGRSKFNGFCFSVNTQKMAPATNEVGFYMFDPSSRIVGQENNLMASMDKFALKAIILQCVFAYHFKSVTVSMANITVLSEKMKPYGVMIRGLEPRSPMVQVKYVDPQTNVTIVDRVVDVREDLRWYHPEEEEDFLGSFLAEYKTTTTAETTNNTVDSLPTKFVPKNIREKKSCGLDMSMNSLFPQQLLAESSVIRRVYRSYPEMQWNIRQSLNCIYPKKWEPQCENLAIGLPVAHDAEVFAKVNSKTIVIAFAVSDPVRHPSAGDVFTAYELAAALERRFSNVRCKFLRNDVDWYSPAALYDVDVLVPLLDSYDLTQVMALYQSSRTPLAGKQVYQCPDHLQIKPTLVTVAWPRNWFHRWMMYSHFGNYDLVLSSSQTAAAFYDYLSDKMGMPVACTIACPRQHAGVTPTKLGSKFGVKPSPEDLLTMNQSKVDLSTTANSKWLYTAQRSRVTVDVLSIATSLHNYQPSATTRETAAKLFHGVDYIFTGSFYGAKREIMSFDPARLLPNFVGRIVGNGWKSAAGKVSKGWLDACTGLLSYDVVKASYSFVKIVVDDANHVTKPWGSVNSRVFDALGAGCLVVSNGVIGMEETFGPVVRAAGLKLPIYNNAQELEDLLRHYLTKDEERLALVRVMQNHVLLEHTYDRRAQQFSDQLTKYFKFSFIPREVKATEQQMIKGETKKLESITVEDMSARDQRDHAKDAQRVVTKDGLCIMVRTSKNQANWLPILLRQFIVQHQENPNKKQMPLQIFIVDTEGDLEYGTTLRKLADSLNLEFKEDYINIVTTHMPSMSSLPQKDITARKKLFGYDDTDRVLSLLLESQYCPNSNAYTDEYGYGFHHYDNADKFAGVKLTHTAQCSWIMATNGDNSYSSVWLKKIMPSLLTPGVDAVAWDFTSHHPRKDGINQTIRVELRRAFIDLGSAVIRAERYRVNNANFLPQSIFTTDLFARDFHMINSTLHLDSSPEGKHGSNVTLIHEVLMMHQ